MCLSLRLPVQVEGEPRAIADLVFHLLLGAREITSSSLARPSLTRAVA
jgi:hypothetical protein